MNFDACIGDRECVEFCKNDVFDWNDALGQPVVARPYNCVVGCNACAQICPNEAISFPSKEELKVTMRRLISEAYRRGESRPLQPRARFDHDAEVGRSWHCPAPLAARDAWRFACGVGSSSEPARNVEEAWRMTLWQETYQEKTVE